MLASVAQSFPHESCALNRGAHFEVAGKDFIIRSLVKDGPAERSGRMKVGDRLLSVDGCEAQGICPL